MNYDNYDCRIRNAEPKVAKPDRRKAAAKSKPAVRGGSRLLGALRMAATAGAALVALMSSASAQITIQPVTEAFSRETKIYEHTPTMNFSSNIAVTSTDIGSNFVSLLQFDLSAVPYTSAEITSATIKLYNFQLGFSSSGAIVNGGTVTMSPILDAWRETAGEAGAAPLATYDAFFGASPTLHFGPVAASTVVGDVGFYTWDITNLVKAWKDGSQPNNGVLIQLASPGGDIGFADVDSNGAANAPSITVVPEPGSIFLGLAGAGALFARRSRQGRAIAAL